MLAAVTIQNKSVDSKNEINVAQAFDRLKIGYIYKYVISTMGLRGGMEVDFVVLPFYWPVEVQVEYWHPENDPAWPLKRAAEWQEFGREPVLLTFEETKTVEAAMVAIRSNNLG